MSINKEIIVKDKDAVLRSEDRATKIVPGHNVDNADIPAIDKSTEDKTTEDKTVTKNEDHSGRKYQADIDGPQQDSQETDEIYADPRQSAGLPPAGKNVGDLNAHDLGRHDKD